MKIGENKHPGAAPYPPELQKELAAALAAKPRDYKPRSEHLHPDGAPKYTNRLILESSPYLIQHAHNPVNWFPWGDEAFAKAKAEKKPVILSVGYSTCHWCHVMERESFEDEEIATALKEKYVLIKVDREERPDIDDVYMMAVNFFTGRGGWPMTVWLTPEGKPFYGGTYFPARDGQRGSRMGFLTLINRLRDSYDREGAKIADHAERVSAAIRKASVTPPADKLPGVREIHAAAAGFEKSFDSAYGGFGGAPKFPQSVGLEFLLRYHRRTQDKQFLDMVTFTLEKMASGGMNDQIGGGFHRYSTDRQWLVPHFEKMLYDNAQLAVIYLEAYQATGREDFARVARETLDYLVREMRAPGGGFYSATDADSEGIEGKFFIWTVGEIYALLSVKEAVLLKSHYGVTLRGNFEHANILHVAMGLDAAAKAAGVKSADARATLDAARLKLYKVREKRVPPQTDTKIIVAWNGLAISALARGARALNKPRYATEAKRTADFILARLEEGGRLKRVWKDGRAKAEGTLEDYAFLTAGLLDLYEATWDPEYIVASKRLSESLEARFIDAEGGGYFLTPSDGEQLIARQKPTRDGALPSGNAVAALNLLRLAEFTSDDAYRQKSDAVVRGASAMLLRSPRSGTKMLTALDFRNDLPKEIVIVKRAPDADAGPLLAALSKAFVPNRVIVLTAEGEEAEKLAKTLPLATGKRAIEGKTTAYVCEKQVCALPTSDPEVFAKQIAKVRTYAEVAAP